MARKRLFPLLCALAAIALVSTPRLGRATQVSLNSFQATSERKPPPSPPFNPRRATVHLDIDKSSPAGVPVYEVELRGDGRVTFTGVRDTKARGLHRHHVRQSKVQALVSEAYEFGFFALQEIHAPDARGAQFVRTVQPTCGFWTEVTTDMDSNRVYNLFVPSDALERFRRRVEAVLTDEGLL